GRAHGSASRLLQRDDIDWLLPRCYSRSGRQSVLDLAVSAFLRLDRLVRGWRGRQRLGKIFGMWLRELHRRETQPARRALGRLALAILRVGDDRTAARANEAHAHPGVVALVLAGLPCPAQHKPVACHRIPLVPATQPKCVRAPAQGVSTIAAFPIVSWAKGS